MNLSCTILFPHQLFESNLALSPDRPIFIIEDSLFFGDPHHPCDFHIQKIFYHRLTIANYHEQLLSKGFQSTIIHFSPKQTISKIIETLYKKGFATFHCIEVDDFILEKRLKTIAKRLPINITFYESPHFLTPSSVADSFFKSEKGYLMAKFYIFQRKRLGILVDRSEKPVGGKWSFDEENRKKLPANVQVPKIPFQKLNPNENKVLDQLQKEFPKAVGKPSAHRPPTTHAEAAESLDLFLKTRFEKFGLYEDAISSQHSILFHSLLTPALNIGLITPAEVIEKTLAYAKSHEIPLNSLEGFVRQIIGWREFIRILYRREGVAMRNQNFFKHTRPLPDSFYKGTTGIPLIDRTIHRLKDSAYCHHIERLMVLGNFMLLCEFNPQHVYRWFMEYFIDAYDWVMVPNVYGMSQFADGGIFATKPYISSSNYIMKMSDECKGSWQKVWDGLFWRFIHRHRSYFESNFRLSMMVKQLDKMAPEKLKSHLQEAERFLSNDCVHSEG